MNNWRFIDDIKIILKNLTYMKIQEISKFNKKSDKAFELMTAQYKLIFLNIH